MNTKIMTLCVAMGLTGLSQINAAMKTDTMSAPKPYRFSLSKRQNLKDNSKITVFQGCSFSGWSASFGVGKYSTKELLAAGAKDKQISSITVGSGLKVVLFKTEDFKGDSTVLSSDKRCLVDIGFNDNVSSIKVYKL